MRPALYFNGLERTTAGLPEKLLVKYYKHRRIDLLHGEVDWHNGQFPELFDRSKQQASTIVQQKGRLAIIGASAGGSMGLNVYEYLCRLYPAADLSLITLNAWLQVEDLGKLTHVALNRSHKQSSVAFLDSVKRAEDITPRLTPANKANITNVISHHDGLVPITTMTIEGVQSYTVPAVTHLGSIVAGAVAAPSILGAQPNQ